MKCLFGLSTSCVILVLMIFGISCTRTQPQKADENQVELEKKPEKASFDKTSSDKAGLTKEKSLFPKELKESVYFAASLERESLRLISKNSALEPTTLFSVLSYAFEVASGTKKSAPRSIDCGRFQIEKAEEPGQLKILKICIKPYATVALVKSRAEDTEFEVTFKIKEWASVVGLSVTLTNSDIVCLLRLKDKKLNSMVCDNWSYFLSASDASATEVRLKTMSFYREQQQQLKLSGGFFHDLIERKKIDITVPLEGKIKLIEKEIEVKDDFADKVKTSEDVLNEKEKGEQSQQNKQEGHQEKDYQKWIKEGGGQNENQIQSQDQSESENVAPPIESQEVNEGETSGGVPQQPTKTRGR